MTVLDAIQARHSVRQYTNRVVSPVVIAQLQYEIDLCNKEFGMHIQLITNDPAAFQGLLPHYGKLEGVCNYIALVGPKSRDLKQTAGYCGERIVLKAQCLGLNTCWTAVTYSKKNVQAVIGRGEQLVCVIAFGYGATQGAAHKCKPIHKLYSAEEPVSEWFMKGMEAAILAPTAMNQQMFRFILKGNKVKAIAGRGFCSGIDLGIVKCHFEIGAGKDSSVWI